MAKCIAQGFEDLEKLFQRLGGNNQVGIKAVKKAAPILEKALKNEVKAAANKGYATGSLENSIKATEAKENSMGAYCVVKPNGKDEKGVSNTEKMQYLEYGVHYKTKSGKTHHQDAMYVRDKAIKKAEKECIAAMEQVVTQEVEGN